MSFCTLFAQEAPPSVSEEPAVTIPNDDVAVDSGIVPVAVDSFMPLVTVGDPGNDADPATGCGAVAESFSIGRSQVTADQYCAFLNAVATDKDPYHLYDIRMGTDENVKCITRSEGEAPYTYSIIEDGKNRGQFPITYVSLYNAARFCNWMEHGRPSSDPDHLTTETGAYMLNGALRGPLARAPGATWFIPGDDELYKSIYYQGGGLHADYYSYPNRSLYYPAHTIGTSNNEANCRDSYGYGARSQAPYLTPVGIFSKSVSAYDVRDTGGNVDQWTSQEENTEDGVLSFVIRGGSWKSSYSYASLNDLQKESYRSVDGTTKSNTLGFRIASSLAATEVVAPTTKAPAESQWTTTEIAGIFGLFALGSYGVKKGCDRCRSEEGYDSDNEISEHGGNGYYNSGIRTSNPNRSSDVNNTGGTGQQMTVQQRQNAVNNSSSNNNRRVTFSPPVVQQNNQLMTSSPGDNDYKTARKKPSDRQSLLSPLLTRIDEEGDSDTEFATPPNQNEEEMQKRHLQALIQAELERTQKTINGAVQPMTPPTDSKFDAVREIIQQHKDATVTSLQQLSDSKEDE